MTREAANLLKKALALPVVERAELAGSIIESLDDAEDQTVKAAWDKEVLRRMAQIDSGEIEPIPVEQARRKLTSALE